MRVLHFYKTYITDATSGVPQVIFQLASGMADKNIHTDVLSLTSDKHAQASVPISGHLSHRSYLNFQCASTGFSLSAFSRFAELVKTADIVHYHFPWPFMDLVHFATRHHKPMIVTYHSDIIRQKRLLKLYQPLMHAFLRSADKIIATSPTYLETSTTLSRYRDKTQVIPIGIDAATYPVPSETRLDYWKQRFPGKFFFFMGMLRYYKGLHVLLDALLGLDYPVVIAGNGPMMASLTEQVTRLGLKNIHFIGAVSDEDKMALFRLSYAFVFPSQLRSEAFGISLLEAAMMGKPLISCEIGTGTTYINKHDETGLVVPPEDANALREAMRFLLDNPLIAAKMGEQAKKRYDQLFTADKMVAEHIDLYQKIIMEAQNRTKHY
jgi:O-antigen biosynthesis rhamnosyltransferase